MVKFDWPTWMYTQGLSNHLPSCFWRVPLFPNVFFWLFSSWTCKINLTDMGNLPPRFHYIFFWGHPPLINYHEHHWELLLCWHTESSSCQTQRSLKRCCAASVNCAEGCCLPTSLLPDVVNQRKNQTRQTTQSERERGRLSLFWGHRETVIFSFVTFYSEQAVPNTSLALHFNSHLTWPFCTSPWGMPSGQVLFCCSENFAKRWWDKPFRARRESNNPVRLTQNANWLFVISSAQWTVAACWTLEAT